MIAKNIRPAYPGHLLPIYVGNSTARASRYEIHDMKPSYLEFICDEALLALRLHSAEFLTLIMFP